MINGFVKRYKDAYDQIGETYQRIKEINERLRLIALRPKPFNGVEYFKLLIKSEKSACKPGYLERIEILEKQMNRIEICQNEEGAFDLKKFNRLTQ